MKKFLTSLLSSEGKVSTKRLISLLAFVMMCIGFIANLFWDFTIEEHIYKAMEWIVEIGMGTIVAERFGKSSKPPVETPIETTTDTPIENQEN
jgi:hypothetical protein